MEQLEIRNLSFSYPDAVRETIVDVSFSISKGEYVLLCGNSGCGKTTLLRHLKSVLTPTGSCRGEILYNGVPLEQVDGAKQASAIGYVMQNPDDQIVTDKVWHELAFGLENLGVSRETIGLRVAEMASFFGIQSWYHRDISQLSGGQKQLLNLASIMAMQPEILILDEPTAQLDPIAASDFLNTLKKINQELGITVLITEHRAEDIFPVADRVLVMEKGHLAANAGPREIGHSLFDARSPLFPMLPAPMRSFYQCGGTGTAPLTVREGRNWLTDVFGEKKPAVRTLPPLPELPKTEPALHIENVWLRYEKQSPDVLKGLTMTVPSGCLYTIVGGNGVGKSTTLRTICGASKPYRGKIQVFGKETKKYPRGELFRNCLSMLPQDPTNLFVKQNVREELEEMNPDKQAQIHAAELCEITHLLDAHPYDLSGGEQQRVALAKVLLTNPRLLLLDEPTKGLDCGFKARFARTLKRLTGEGMTIVMVSHDIEFCAEHADIAAMFFDGQIIASGRPREFFGSNSFYTTSSNRMSRCIFENAVTAEDVTALYKENLGDGQ
ncbi:ATP-binding cassette domain-containing protein [Pseudoflavonifractor sp. MSJ-30]|uniref:ABC transporter ATP-binding protein n=1 Tax=Pseudoflavonifractor sp. MSJ-30 TaxID=2841525 RepID=UPI001C12038C|nr:ABC transporter ATP-binding protein [Pseudoflavonifractor sp. MSJ-30]MBU5452069.1 ATP-binding cassette domain-containing protein [Pseudoflavonifractor sp. MSJ-30]